MDAVGSLCFEMYLGAVGSLSSCTWVQLGLAAKRCI